MALHGWVLGTKYFDKKREKNYPGKTKVYIYGEDKLRMDIFDPFGFVTVGTLIINGDQMSLDMIQGEGYKGPIDSDKVRKLLKVDVNPKDLFSLFTQTGFEDKHWSCAVDEKGLALKECMSGAHQMNVRWSGQMTQKGTEVSLDHVRAKLLFKVKSYKSYPDYDERLFKL